jgi:hypothetical protein
MTEESAVSIFDKKSNAFATLVFCTRDGPISTLALLLWFLHGRTNRGHLPYPFDDLKPLTEFS